jgi:CubicO group peptidase (beta-lactamase class C family)
MLVYLLMQARAVLFFSVICIVATVVAFSQTSPPRVHRLDGSTISASEIDTAVTRLMLAAKVPGIAIAILNDNRVAYEHAYGFRDKDNHLPLTTASIMTSASLTKSAFACLAMQLVEQGALNLDKPVYEYLPKPLPDYPNYKDLATDPRYKKITARMLLDHTSGFPNWRRFTDDGKLSLAFEPGSRFAYSGEGIDLLQFVVETITRQSLTVLMRDRIFQPFGMTRTGMVWESRFESDFANAYDERGRSLGPQRRRHPSAAGSMQSNLHDFTLFMQGVMQGKIISPKMRDLMLSPQISILSKHEFPTFSSETTDANQSIRLSYGLGWGLYFTPYGKAFFKEGHDEGFMHYAVGFPDAGIALVIMSNSSNTEGIYKVLLETLLGNTYTPIEWEGFIPYNHK